MRNAIVSGGLVITVDNSVAIGEKPLDAVQAPYDIVSAFTMRVIVLEQLCANGQIEYITMGNGAGADAYDGYLAGIQRVFDDIGELLPPLAVSTETNMPTQQSALTVTAIGKQQPARTKGTYRYIIGMPHVGQSVLQHPHEIAPLAELYALWQSGVITHIWPTGSKGIAVECQRFFGEVPNAPLPMDVTCGPSTVVLAYTTEPLALHVPLYLF